MTAALVALYLGAIVAANIITARFGPSASVYNAFALIGLDLTTRDRLHDFWREHRAVKMGGLIVAGSVVSYVATVAIGSAELPESVAARIALGSAVAFGTAALADALLYHRLREHPWLERANVSNLLSAVVDSVVFVWIAFGLAGNWPIIFGQITAKVAGGFVWSLMLARRREVATTPIARL